MERKNCRKARRKNGNSKKNPDPGIRQNYELRPIEPKNEALFDYYRKQGIISEEEWNYFIEILKVELPVSFRVQLCLRERDQLVRYIEEKFIKEITNIAQTENENSGLDPPKLVPYIPYAYQMKMSRAAVRSHPILKDFHEFLINETELGYTSRQEVCSMIPPLLLDIGPNHIVLDACAAPGSKTMQILELMHTDTPDPKGMLVANDVDYKRCYLLVHQTLKRMPVANLVVVSHDMAKFPTIFDSAQKPVLFDRILCDLICSGDGTFRKNPELWNTWDPMKAVHLHKLQLQIVRRCVQLLKSEGLMCYSTCSLNPLEDEAVVAHILRTSQGTLELIDVSDKLPGLKRTPGISKWKVFDKNLREYSSLEQVGQPEKRHFKPSMFPPEETEAKELHLERTFRILPHHQNTGGFFVALIRKKKTTEMPTTESNLQQEVTILDNNLGRKPPMPKKRRNLMNNEDPFVFLEEHESEKELREEMETHFGISGETFPYSNLLVRSNNTKRKKEVYYLNDKIRELLLYNINRLKIVNSGLGVLKKITSDKVAPCPYRLKQDGLPVLMPFIKKRCLDIPIEFMITVLKGGKTAALEREEGMSQYVPMHELGEYAGLFKGLDPGSLILRMAIPFPKEICAWIGANSVSAFVSREERFHLLSILGQDVTKYRRNLNTTRQEKALRVNDQGNDEEIHEAE